MRRLHASRGVVIRSADILAGVLGTAASYGMRGLKVAPSTTAKIQGIAEIALRRAFETSIIGIDRTAWMASPARARLLAGASGAIGGFMGLAGYLPDAFFTTLLIMRNIAAIAREEGEDLAGEDARKACLEVFAFGSPALEADDKGEDVETGYWSSRLLLHGRPMMMVLSEVAARYGVRISEKLAAQAVPLVGAAGGAMINTVFLDHYRNMARVHFAMRRLERSYGALQVRNEAQAIALSLHLARAA